MIYVLIAALVIVFVAVLVYLLSSGGDESNIQNSKTTPTRTDTTTPFLSEVDTPPKIRRKGVCEYPEQAKKLGKSALVNVDVHIDTNGEIIEVQIPKMIGYGFEQAAIKHVRTWGFTPASHKGKLIDAWIRVPVRFTLEKR